MTETFRKSREDAPPGFFETEAAGLRWLAVDGGPRVARVLDVGPDHLGLERLAPASATPSAARALGRSLSAMHDAGAPAFGALPPGAATGFFGPLDDPLEMVAGSWSDWPTFYAEARLRPVLGQGRRRGVFDDDDAHAFAKVCERLPELAGPAEAPARLHGDLWSGNVLWAPGAEGGGEAVLIDPAAHGGHREADLAMLAMFGAPHLDQILDGYTEARSLAPGWRGRLGLHQLYPLAVHAVLFGGGYVETTRRLLADLGA
ncbi:fructosamine kinase family protein [Isoptericola halotolerans]|uniref:Fructosamine-3-kinase n=1 Tax=Isoptericola halotolerans TaxID=300560 RepID=A0ABX2A6J4_9MICO|nr:fructosamine-3-kinase [Isoptericola halotolerans]